MENLKTLHFKLSKRRKNCA